MSKVESFARPARDLLVAMLLLAFLVLTTGCGGSSGAPQPPAGNDPPVVTPDPPSTAIEGVATPTSVAVVTATNAQ